MRTTFARLGLIVMVFSAALAGCGSSDKSGNAPRDDDRDSGSADPDAGSGDGNSRPDAGFGEPDAGADDADAGADDADAGSEPPRASCEKHTACEEGVALAASCNECTRRVCEDDDFCCSHAWGEECVASAILLAECDCTEPDPTPWACDETVSAIAKVPSGGFCAVLFDCNPVTNQGCNTAAGEACDYDASADDFRCYPSSLGQQELCEPCSGAIGFCKAGYACMDTGMGVGVGLCARYCCSDADCGTNNTCDFKYIYGVGVCAAAEGG